ncbi:hypothetical protein [Nocardia sp. NPDC050710]|uniref:hypothetical protein n=1 Tax=Nocardia sp. NPDC050710 TaxID=3157220 RepID=UPI0033D4548B
MNTTTTAEILHRQLVLPVRAVRAGLNASGRRDTPTAVRHAEKIPPLLDVAADCVTAARHRVEKTAARMERGADNEWPDVTAACRKAVADTLANVDGVHEALTKAARSLDR